MSHRPHWVLAAFALAFLSRPAGAVTVDGALDPAYGSANWIRLAHGRAEVSRKISVVR